MSYLKNFNTIADAKSSTTLKSPIVIVVNDNNRKRVIYKRIPSARDEELLVDGETLNDVFVSIPYNKIIYTTTDGEITITEDEVGLDWLDSIGYSNIVHGNHCEMIFDEDLTEIGGWAFTYCSSITNINIPESVTNIGNSAFYGCSGLTSITIPNSVTSIVDYAFAYCSSITNINIPESVTNIGNSAFYGCSSLTSITIPNSVTNIGDGAFACFCLISIVVEFGNTNYDSRENCNAIINTASNTLIAGCKNTIIPNSVTSIRDFAFAGCSGLTSITIPNSVTSIGSSAFSYCSSLTNINIPESVTNIGISVFRDCSGLTSITIPNSVTSIGGSAFIGCSSLTSITIPEYVTSIGIYAFEGCSGLTSITCLATTPPTLGSYNVLSNVQEVRVPSGSVNAYKSATNWSSYGNKIVAL